MALEQDRRIWQANQSRALPRPIALSLLLIVATVVAGLALRFVPFGLPAGVSKYGGSALWALLIYWIVSSVFRRIEPRRAALASGLISATVEIFKLCHSPGLDQFRRTVPGMLMLGSIFSVWDMFAYWLGIEAGVLIDRKLRDWANRRR